MEKEWLIDKYVVQGKSTTDIAEELNKDPKTIYYWLKKYNIPRRKVGTMSQERINRNRLSVSCFYCGKEFLKSPARAKRRDKHFCTHRCSELYNSGENNVNYKGLKVDQTGRASFEYKEWRKAVLKRDNFTCQSCGNNKNLHVHHLTRYADCEELRVDLNNGITLCKPCHYEAHR